MFKRTVPTMRCVRLRNFMEIICSLSESPKFVPPNPTDLGCVGIVSQNMGPLTVDNR